MPIAHNMHLSPLTVPIPFFMAMNLAPETEVSTAGCRFENQMSGAEFKNAKKQVRERLTN
jgi:hypothetical protein